MKNSNLSTIARRVVSQAAVWLVALLCFSLISCDENKVFMKYSTIADEGWERNDDILFTVDHIKEKGAYDISLLLRNDSRFPYTSLQVISRCSVWPSAVVHADTLECVLTDDRGNTTGRGVNVYQHSYHIGTFHFNEGDSVQIDIRHNMRRESLAGISDVGLLIEHAAAP